MPLYQHRHLSSRTQHWPHRTDHKKERGTRGLVLQACDPLTRDAHATWQPASTLRMASLPLDWHRTRWDINANSDDILEFSIHSKKVNSNKNSRDN